MSFGAGVVNERELFKELQTSSGQGFVERLVAYDESMVPVMKARGFRFVQRQERTIAFTFGEVTFKRRRWKRGDEWCVPVDEKLGLKKHQRYSEELIYHIVHLASFMSYDQVVQVLELSYQVTIHKPTVVRAIQYSAQLLEEKKDFRFYKEENLPKKIPCPILYIEGDGVFLKTCEPGDERRFMDCAHFVVHTGSKRITPSRTELQNKMEVFSSSNQEAREELLDVLYNHYAITPDTLLITNSDGGHGYGARVFTEIARAFGIKRHEHFIDAYHLHQKIKTIGRVFSYELMEACFEAIKSHSRKLLEAVLDTMEGLVDTDAQEEFFQQFSTSIKRQFRYTKPANLRGIVPAGIGIIESQHRKITFRMKHRGMYWSRKGAQAMGSVIILTKFKELRELFFGGWRKDRTYYVKEQETRHKEVYTPSQVPKGKLHVFKLKPAY